MTIAEFLTNFGEVANAPGGVARLRELVFQLAATGLLTVGDNSEEDVHMLISKLTKERRNLIDRGAIRNNALVPAVDLSGSMPAVPSHWGWIRLGNLASKIGSGSTPRGGSQVYVSKGVPFLRSQNIWNDGIRLNDVVYIDPETHQGMRNTQVCPHDILLNITGASLGRCASVPSNFPTANVSQHVTIIRPLMADTRHFIRICLLSPYGQQMIWGRQVGMAREGLSKKVLEQFEIPLPPLAEQKRIVAKVDELMALCDQLEAQQRERQRRFPVLSRTCHARFAEAPTPENLNRIFDETGTVSPDDLRKTIINFAVQGFLVNQEPTDEPAFDAWARIQKVRLAAGEKDFGYLHEDEAPFAIPKGWCWIKMGNLALSSDSGWSPQCESTPRNGTNWGVLKVSAVSWDDFNPDENKAFPAGMSPRPECEVHNGDFLLSRANTEELVARSVVVTTTPPHLMMSDKIVRFNFPEELEKRYINFANSATFARSHYAKHASGTSSSMKNVGRGTMCNLAIPFPPLAEQKRIVSKVDELMALVDQLEAQQQERDKLAEAFAKACVASFTGTTQLERPEKMKAPNF